MKGLLENQANLGSAAVGAAALGEILTTTRSSGKSGRSQALQQQWKQCCKAEIDLSVERQDRSRCRAGGEDARAAESSGSAGPGRLRI